MRFRAVVVILQVLSCLLLVPPGCLAADDSVQLSESFGGPHGTEFSDQASVAAGQTIGSITIRAGERVDGIALEVAGPTAATFSHGGAGGDEKKLVLGADEYITSMEAHWAEKKGRTRIFYLSFGTSAGNSVSGGSMTESKNTVTAPKGFQLGGFFGQDGNEIDKLGAIWTRISAEAPAPASVEPSSAGPGSELPAAKTTADSAATSAVASTEASAATSSEASGEVSQNGGPVEDSSEATSAAASTEASAADSSKGGRVEDSAEASTEASGAASPKGGRVQDSAEASTEASGAASPKGGRVQDSAEASTEASGAASPKGGRVQDSAEASTEASGAASPKGGRVEDSAEASTEASGAASPKGGRVEDSAEASTEASGAASPKGGPVDSAEGSAAGSTKTSATRFDEAAASEGASAADSAEASAAASAESSAAGSAPTSAAASTAGSAAAPPAGTEAPGMTVKDSIQVSESFGGPHGIDFSDKNFVNSGQVVSAISIYAGERLDGIMMDITSPKTLTFTHGGTGGALKKLKLGEGEYIKSMELHWGKKDDHTRIFYINFVTSAGNSLAGGSMTDDKTTLTAPEGFQLGGFFGKAAKEIDTLGAVWAYIDLVTPAPTPVPAPTRDTDLSSPGTVAPADIAGSLSEVENKANKRAVQLSESFGGPHGDQFSDQLAVTSGMTVSSVTIRAGERLDGLVVQISGPKEMTFTHGGTGGKENTLTLERDEYITTMEAHYGQKGGHTRIFYLSLTTSAGNTVSGGSQTDEKGSVTAPKGYQLAGFFGRFGDEIDLIGAVWSSIETVNETVSGPVPSDENIVLGELFGGPHGLAFSDINDIKFGQTATSLTIRSDERVDAVTLQVSKPAAVTMSHGGKGGTEQTLTLAEGEYINSMEAHWAKKDKHTRVFYLSFTTSAGNTISGGTKTESSGTATAPEGFMLSGFYGRAEDEVDQLGAIWTRMSAKSILLTDPSGVGNGTYGTTIRNWVGPTVGKSSDTACYRKTAAFDSNNICPLGYGKDGDDCIAQCPMAYPVSCALECIPQNDDCALAVLAKIGSVIAVALNAATAGVFGEMYALYKTAKLVITCTAAIVQVIRGLLYYLRYQQTTAPQGDTAELLTVAYQADVVLYDLPIAVCTCLNIPVPANAKYADMVLVVVEGIVKQAITNGDEIISTGANVMSLITGNELANSSATTVDELQDLIDKNSSCGYELKRLTDRVTRAVLKYRNTTKSIDDVRVKVYKSAIVLNDIPIVTNNCMGELLATKRLTAAYETRDLLRRTFEVIVDQLIDTGKTDNGKDVADDEYMLKVANMGLVVLSAVDPTGIAYMASQFVQPICGPTAYLGEIDDGTLNDALGLTAVDEAFVGSYGSWTHSGDGVVHLIFESTDTKDVTVVIHTGGDEYAEVDVGAGDTTTWDATIPELQDKNMYLDRWRPGLFGLPGSGGGSLLLWVPRSSEGGHITMHVRINPS